MPLSWKAVRRLIASATGFVLLSPNHGLVGTSKIRFSAATGCDAIKASAQLLGLSLHLRKPLFVHMVYLSDSSETSHLVQLTPRRGGGGKGGSKGGGKSSGGKTGSSGGSSNGGTGSGSSGSSSGTKSSSKAVPFAAGAGLGFGAAHSSASSFSSGGGPRTILSSGSPFSGREAGGGTRVSLGLVNETL